MFAQTPDDDLNTSIVQNPESPSFLNFIDEMNSEMAAADENTPLPREGACHFCRKGGQGLFNGGQ